MTSIRLQPWSVSSVAMAGTGWESLPQMEIMACQLLNTLCPMLLKRGSVWPLNQSSLSLLPVRTSALLSLRLPKPSTIISRHMLSFHLPTHMMYLYQELKSEIVKAGWNTQSMRRVWVASDNWSSSSSVHGNLTLDEIGHIVGFTFKSGDMSSFREFLSRLEAAGQSIGSNSFMQEFYMQLNANKGFADAELVSKAVKTLREHTHADTIFSVELAVSAIAQAVASICRSRACKTPGRVQPWQVFSCLCVCVCAVCMCMHV